MSERVCTDGRVPDEIRERVPDCGAGNWKGPTAVSIGGWGPTAWLSLIVISAYMLWCSLVEQEIGHLAIKNPGLVVLQVLVWCMYHVWSNSRKEGWMNANLTGTYNNNNAYIYIAQNKLSSDALTRATKQASFRVSGKRRHRQWRDLQIYR